MKTFIKYILACSFVLGAITTQAQTPEQLFAEGNSLYAAGKFAEAAQKYETVVSQGYESAELYYNLGNAYFRTKVYPKAILNYERAKLHAPNDESVLFNLQLAQQQTVDKIEPLPRFFISAVLEKIGNWFSANMWGVFCIIMFLIASTCFAVYLLSPNVTMRKLSFLVALLFLFVASFNFVLAYRQTDKLVERNTAIIFTPTVNIKSSPDDAGADLFTLHEGTKVEIQEELNGWVEIRIENGNVGWLQLEHLARI